MEELEFIQLLESVCTDLTKEAREKKFLNSAAFETRVRQAVDLFLRGRLGSSGSGAPSIIDFNPAAQGFPDIPVGKFGIEVKFTEKDTWRSVANSVLESNRVKTVEKVFLVFGNMGADLPEVRWGEYEKSVMHVRTSHVPRFEVELPAREVSLFDEMGISYNDFRGSPMEIRMQHIRKYARKRLKEGERLWWLEDPDNSDHSLSVQPRLFTKLSTVEKLQYRAEAVLLCPRVCESGRSKTKYDDVVLYLLTYRGVLCHQARDLFSAGSVADPKNEKKKGLNIQKAITLIQSEIVKAAAELEPALFEEYWGKSVLPKDRIKHWLGMADEAAKGNWIPSATLFLNSQTQND
jgi:hypothetical protein